ncbi:unnamed protein product [Cylicocyclus nassatus]|uniref:Uncharacterized protein n=1 Tax=Cylicocyclus nassatus TaxID=53992 RepID=A0AA36MCV1_CYLNA|nr:unnamed protein product [Cylicocyclus nassatus]
MTPIERAEEEVPKARNDQNAREEVLEAPNDRNNEEEVLEAPNGQSDGERVFGADVQSELVDRRWPTLANICELETLVPVQVAGRLIRVELMQRFSCPSPVPQTQAIDEFISTQRIVDVDEKESKASSPASDFSEELNVTPPPTNTTLLNDGISEEKIGVPRAYAAS